ncbi:hypothetical protein BDV32DRAFT_122529 [Aspergillus pseudonomiae]|nr:hypothetical protein BDV32DRAFT_122529 [Aspergillus pseudonomiae]
MQGKAMRGLCLLRRCLDTPERTGPRKGVPSRAWFERSKVEDARIGSSTRVKIVLVS